MTKAFKSTSESLSHVTHHVLAIYGLVASPEILGRLWDS
jgi:hypothetical protein